MNLPLNIISIEDYQIYARGTFPTVAILVSFSASSSEREYRIVPSIQLSLTYRYSSHMEMSILILAHETMHLTH